MTAVKQYLAAHAKAFAGGVGALASYAALRILGHDLDPTVDGLIVAVVTYALVHLVPNKQPA